MFCGKCGVSNPEGGRFFLRCGAPLIRPEPPVEPETIPPAAPFVPAPEHPNRDKEEKQAEPRPKRQKSSAGRVFLVVLLTFLITAVAAVVLQLTGTLDRLVLDLSRTRPTAEDTETPAEDRDEKNGTASEEPAGRLTFDTPEAAVEQFLCSLQRDDVEGAVAACAVEEYVEYGDWITYAERMGAVQRNMYYTDLNEMMQTIFFQQRQTEYLNGISGIIHSLLAQDSALADSLRQVVITPLNRDEKEALEEYNRLMGAFSFRNAEFIGYAEYALSRNQRTQLLPDEVRESYGCLDAAEYIYLIHCGQDFYVGGLTLYQYENGWKIGLLGAVNANTVISGLYCFDALRGMTTDEVIETLLDEYGDDYPDYTLLN